MKTIFIPSHSVSSYFRLSHTPLSFLPFRSLTHTFNILYTFKIVTVLNAYIGIVYTHNTENEITTRQNRSNRVLEENKKERRRVVSKGREG